jgi:hypothetical protein
MIILENIFFHFNFRMAAVNNDIAINTNFIDYDSLVLTRYLYNKTKVLDRLEESILLGNKEEAYFWAYEIYFSFLQNELFERFFFILKTDYSNYPRLYKYLFERYTEWKIDTNKLDMNRYPKSDEVDMIIAVFIENIIMRNRGLKEPKRQFYLLVPFDIEFINLYKTINIEPSRKTLETACKYSLIYTKTQLEICDKHTLSHIIDHWLYYASRAPIWRERIYNYGGEIIDEEKSVLFDNDDQLEEFYENYGFELDEQIIEIQRKTIGI